MTARSMLSGPSFGTENWRCHRSNYSTREACSPGDGNSPQERRCPSPNCQNRLKGCHFEARSVACSRKASLLSRKQKMGAQKESNVAIQTKKTKKCDNNRQNARTADHLPLARRLADHRVAAANSRQRLSKSLTGLRRPMLENVSPHQ